MKYIDSEKLYEYLEQVNECYPRYAENIVDNAVSNVIGGIKAFITSLQQERRELPGIEEPGIPGKDFIPVEWVDACEMYGKWKIVKQEPPDVDLEKEIDDYYHANLGLILSQVDTKVIVSEIARHFFELGLNARKEDAKMSKELTILPGRIVYRATAQVKEGEWQGAYTDVRLGVRKAFLETFKEGEAIQVTIERIARVENDSNT